MLCYKSLLSKDLNSIIIYQALHQALQNNLIFKKRLLFFMINKKVEAKNLKFLLVINIKNKIKGYYLKFNI